MDILKTNTDVNEGNKVRLKDNYNNGLEKEEELLNILYENGIIFKHNERYSVLDYNYNNDDVNIFIELKTRTIQKDYYKTTILAKNKVKYYLNNKDDNKKNYLFVIFGFIKEETDDNSLDYYYIQYTTNFKNYKPFYNRYENNKEYYQIPIEDLKPIDELLKTNLFKGLKC